MPEQRIASSGSELPALARVPDWTSPPDAARRPAGPRRDVARLASQCLEPDPGKKHPVRPGDSLGEMGPDWPTRFARMVTEALAGARPAAQILPWTSKRARSQFLRLSRAFASPDNRGACGRAGGGAGGLGRGRGQLRIVRVVASRPARDAIEMSVIARFGERVRALALRLERTARADSPGEWICTDIEAA
ncbi:MAG TPA: Rv3235 family protein [Trebonia sp.]|nr:Rv3235 family protein [Trebonia sp.]